MREGNPDLPSRIGERWSDEEENQALTMLSEGNSNEDIAKSLQRTVSSIKERLLHISYKMYSDNVPMHEIIEKTQIPEEEIRIKIDKERSKSVRVKEKNDSKVEKTLTTATKAIMLTVPTADLLDIKLLLHEIRDLLREQNRRR